MVEWAGFGLAIAIVAWGSLGNVVGLQMTDDREPIWPKLEDYEPPKATTPWGKLPIKPKPQGKKD